MVVMELDFFRAVDGHKAISKSRSVAVRAKAAVEGFRN
jgi:hypothetical protein